MIRRVRLEGFNVNSKEVIFNIGDSKKIHNNLLFSEISHLSSCERIFPYVKASVENIGLRMILVITYGASNTHTAYRREMEVLEEDFDHSVAFEIETDMTKFICKLEVSPTCEECEAPSSP